MTPNLPSGVVVARSVRTTRPVEVVTVYVRATPTPDTLDVECLAAAICNGEARRHPGSPRYDRFSEAAKDLFRREAAELASEYATLAALNRAIEAEATPTPDTRLREALLSIIREAEEVTEAQHGTPHGALYAIIRRAREALDATREETT